MSSGQHCFHVVERGDCKSFHKNTKTVCCKCGQEYNAYSDVFSCNESLKLTNEKKGNI